MNVSGSTSNVGYRQRFLSRGSDTAQACIWFYFDSIFSTSDTVAASDACSRNSMVLMIVLFCGCLLNYHTHVHAHTHMHIYTTI